MAYLANVTGAGGDTLGCGSCHSASGAHNWAAGSELGLDANWKPVRD